MKNGGQRTVHAMSHSGSLRHRPDQHVQDTPWRSPRGAEAGGSPANARGCAENNDPRGEEVLFPPGKRGVGSVYEGNSPEAKRVRTLAERME